MTLSPTRLLALAGLLLLLTLAACGNTSSSPASSNSTTPVAADGNANAPEGAVPGGEAALTVYQDTTFKFAINRPSAWTQDTTFSHGVRFLGGDGTMTVEFLQNSNSDLMTYAKNDVTAFAPTQPTFQQVNLYPSTEVPNAVVLGFTSSGTSSVTGKAYTARGDRYYISLPDGRLAILTVNEPTNQYDREGIRDIALSLKVMK